MNIMTLEQLVALGLTEEVAKKVLEAYQAALKDKFVPIERFNEVNEAKKQAEESLKERDKQLKGLAEKAKGNEELTKQIADLQESNKKTAEDYEAKIKQMQFDHALDTALKAANAKNAKAVRALLKLDAVKLDGETFTGLKEQLDELKKSDAYLFDTAVKGKDPNKTGTSEPGGKNPWKKETFNLTEQGKILREDPELAKQLMAAAK
jgi:hypothetical protein